MATVRVTTTMKLPLRNAYWSKNAYWSDNSSYVRVRSQVSVPHVWFNSLWPDKQYVFGTAAASAITTVYSL